MRASIFDVVDICRMAKWISGTRQENDKGTRNPISRMLPVPISLIPKLQWPYWRRNSAYDTIVSIWISILGIGGTESLQMVRLIFSIQINPWQSANSEENCCDITVCDEQYMFCGIQCWTCKILYLFEQTNTIFYRFSIESHKICIVRRSMISVCKSNVIPASHKPGTKSFFVEDCTELTL